MTTLISKLPWLSRMRSRPVVSLIGIVALLLAGTFAVIAWVSGGTSSTVNSREMVNAEGRYRFEAPDGWSITQQGRTTTVTSPDKSTVITLGPGRNGPLPVAGTHLFQQVASNYQGVQVIPPDAKQVGPRSALVYGGVGNNKQNTRVRFLAITVENEPTNYGITVFTADGSDPEAVLPSVNRVVDTFRVLP
jgi:hypothetical protein